MNMEVPQEVIDDLEKRTRGQSNNPLWFKARNGRFTASKLCDILDGIKRNQHNRVRNLVLPPPQKKSSAAAFKRRSEAVAWGMQNEKKAIQEYCNSTGNTVVTSGFWVDSSGCLGCSPDGLVGDDTLLEVKCPWTKRETGFNVEDGSFWVHRVNGRLRLNQKYDQAR